MNIEYAIKYVGTYKCSPLRLLIITHACLQATGHRLFPSTSCLALSQHCAMPHVWLTNQFSPQRNEASRQHVLGAQTSWVGRQRFLNSLRFSCIFLLFITVFLFYFLPFHSPQIVCVRGGLVVVRQPPCLLCLSLRTLCLHSGVSPLPCRHLGRVFYLSLSVHAAKCGCCSAKLHKFI